MAYASRFLSRSKQLQGSLVILQQHHAIPVRAFAKEAARPTFKGDEMLKGVFTEIKNKFLAAVDILRKEKITLDPEDPAAVKQYANVMKTIRQKADMFSESQRIKYDIENETKEIPDARAYLLKLKDIRTRRGLTDELGAEAMMFEALEKVEKDIKKPLLRSDKKGMDLLVAEFEKGNKMDTPVAIDRFLGYWKPNAIVIMENELWPNLIMSAAQLRIPLALLNARMSTKSFKRWSSPLLLPLASLLLSKFSLIAPLSTLQGIHFQLLQAPPFVINFSGDLKYVVNKFYVSSGTSESIRDLKAELSDMKVWIASSLHRGEEEVILGVHNLLLQSHPDSVVIIVPRHPHHGHQIAQKLRNDGQSVALRSRNEKITSKKTNIYVVDTLGELREFYGVAPIAVIGGSFFPELTGHNVSEAAAAGCAVITGCHVGHFSHMVKAMQQANPLSITQVSSKLELREAVELLMSNPEILEARQRASKEVYESLSSCIISNVWNLLNLHIFRGK